MKIRNGFVSNSSSSSFLIYGASISIDPDHLEDLPKYGLQFVSGEDNYYIGRSWDSIKDDETGLQFKQSIEKGIGDLKKDHPELSESIGKISTQEESWYNG